MGVGEAALELTVELLLLEDRTFESYLGLGLETEEDLEEEEEEGIG